jgi:hypothetical protein
MDLKQWLRRIGRKLENPGNRGPDDPSQRQPGSDHGPNTNAGPGASTPFHGDV